MEYWLQNKTDEEKARILERLIHCGNLRTPPCVKCGAVVGYADRKTINVSIYGRKGQKSKKLCTLCNECYSDLLDYLCVADVDWGEDINGFI
jgi:hypothetical protein